MAVREVRSGWFRSLFGIEEIVTRGSYEHIHEAFILSPDQGIITSKANNRRFHIGKFYTPSLGDLRREVQELLSSSPSVSEIKSSKTSFDHLPINDILGMHSAYPHAVFQAASQFNCLEFPSPYVTPEQGIEGYTNDPTQGPACALACAAGTLYRNYFIPMGEGMGQRSDRQINNLDSLEALLENEKNHYWYIQNGYSFTDSEASLLALQTRLNALSPAELDVLRASIKIGLHENVGVVFASKFTEVPTNDDDGVQVTQAYCSALSCAYNSAIKTVSWEPLARLVLEAAYEATLLSAVRNVLLYDLPNSHSTSSPSNQPTTKERDTHRDVFLTSLGGGVFGNDPQWIAQAIGRSLALISAYNVDLRVHICHHRRVNASFEAAVREAYLHYQTELQEK